MILREATPQQVYVGSEVANSCRSGPMTSLQALMASGGAKHTARLSQVVLIRYLGETRRPSSA